MEIEAERNMGLPPTCKSTMAFKMEDRKSQQRSNDTGNTQSSPEEAESDWQLTTGIKVGEPKHQIWNKATLKKLSLESP
jgi:hypothetical protein